MKKNYISKFLLIVCSLMVASCGNTTKEPSSGDSSETTSLKSEHEGVIKMNFYIEDKSIPVLWENNESVIALKELASKGDITINMSMYGGFEQVGSFGQSLPRNDVQTTTKAGDIVLYSGNQVVVFYGSNTWAYTRLGKMDIEETEIIELLSKGNVTLKITK